MGQVIPPPDLHVEIRAGARNANGTDCMQKRGTRDPQCQPRVHRKAIVALEDSRELGDREGDERVDDHPNAAAFEPDKKQPNKT